jgi:hypothetical protein
LCKGFFRKTWLKVTIFSSEKTSWNHPILTIGPVHSSSAFVLFCLWRIFSILGKIFSNKFCHKFTFKKIIPKNCHNCLQYERVLKIVYFHILNIAKFG